MIIPEDTSEFFESFFPEQFARERHRYPREDSPGSALFEIDGVGCWGFRIQNGDLVITRGKDASTMLQIGLSSDDFRAIFVERTRREVASKGAISDDSRDAFRPLFIGSKKVSSVSGATATLAIDLDHDGEKRALYITPGAGDRTTPKTTLSMTLDDFLPFLAGRKNPVWLFLTGKLRIHGDISYALKMKAILS